MAEAHLYHFSESGDIARFDPRPPAILPARAPGFEWLNGPLVWAIDAWHQPMYLFPRDCPRILVWPTDATRPADLARHWPAGDWRMCAYVERGWLDRIGAAHLWRYRLPAAPFETLNDAGMWVSRSPVVPRATELIGDLVAALTHKHVCLRPVDDMRQLRALWDSGFHVSGIRLRNAACGWP